MKNNNEQQPTVITGLNLTVVKAVPQIYGKDIAAIILEIDEYSDFRYRLFGWLSTDGYFFHHFSMYVSDIIKLENELESMGYYVCHTTLSDP